VSPDEFFMAATELSDVSQGVWLDEQEFIVGWYP
jgi:hypothetical protein